MTQQVPPRSSKPAAGPTAEAAAGEQSPSDLTTSPTLTYSAHVIGADDVEASGDGFAGTIGKGEHLDTLTVSLGRGNSGDVTVSLLNNGNWSDWAGDGTPIRVSDTPFEGLKVRLSEELSHNYSIWYRVHSSEFGWLGWAHDGEEVGSTGYARCVEAIEIRFVAKGDAAPGSEANALLDAANELPKINYAAHVATIGWQAGVTFDEAKLDSVPVAGTTGRSLSMEALSASISWLGHGGGVEVRSHVQDYWTIYLCQLITAVVA